MLGTISLPDFYVVSSPGLNVCVCNNIQMMRFYDI